MDDDGLRDCSQGEFCASATTEQDEDGNRVRVPARGPRAFCTADQAKIAAAVNELPRLYVQLLAELGTPVKRETMVHTVFGPSVPLRAAVDTLIREYEEILPSWHNRVASVARLSPPGTGRPHVVVGRALDILSAPGRLNVLLALGPGTMTRSISHEEMEESGDIEGVVRPGFTESTPELSGADAGLEILRLHYRSRAVLGETRPKPVELLGVPCRREDCDMLALQRAELPSDPAEDPPWSICSVCGDTMSEAEYRRWVQRYARWWNDGGDQRPVLEDFPEAS